MPRHFFSDEDLPERDALLRPPSAFSIAVIWVSAEPPVALVRVAMMGLRWNAS